MQQEENYRLMEQFEERIAAARGQLALTWSGRNNIRPSVIFSDVNYALCGQHDIPEDYFKPESMFRYQMRKIYRHMLSVPDDYVPVLHPWYGTTVVPSALGVPVRWSKTLDPSLSTPILKDPEDILKLRAPDPERDGQMPMVLDCIDYMRNHTDVPVCLTDGQGPLNIALGLAGVENLFIWMYEEPEAVHRLMRFCTDVLIDWVKVQKRHLGHKSDGNAYPHAIEMPPGFGGVAFADDDLITMGTNPYREFVVPYNEEVLLAFGGGSLHFCGSAHHQTETICGMHGIRAVNNFCLGDFTQIRMLHKKMAGRGALMACDFNAEDIQWHCDNLIKLAQQPEGLVIGVFITPDMALLQDGKYTESARNTEEITCEYVRILGDAGLLPNP